MCLATSTIAVIPVHVILSQVHQNFDALLVCTLNIFISFNIFMSSSCVTTTFLTSPITQNAVIKLGRRQDARLLFAVDIVTIFNVLGVRNMQNVLLSFVCNKKHFYIFYFYCLVSNV